MRVQFVILVLCFGLLGCWEKQDHTIARPDLPNYTVAGSTVVMYHTDSLVTNARLELSAQALNYDTTFQPQTSTVNASGFFEFDTVFPGLYDLRLYWNEQLVIDQNLNVGHEDRVIQLEVPKPLQTELQGIIYFGAPFGGPLLITKRGSRLWLNGGYEKPRRVGFDYLPGIHKAELEYDPNSVRFFSDEVIDNPLIRSELLDTANDLFYLARGDSLVLVEPTTGGVRGAMALDEKHQFNALFENSAGLWTVSGSNLQFRGNDVRTIDESYSVDAGYLNAITMVGNDWYVFDASRTLLLRLQSDGTVIDAYRILERNSGAWVDVQDMAYKSRLFVTDTNYELFTIQLP